MVSAAAALTTIEVEAAIAETVAVDDTVVPTIAAVMTTVPVATTDCPGSSTPGSPGQAYSRSLSPGYRSEMVTPRSVSVPLFLAR